MLVALAAVFTVVVADFTVGQFQAEVLALEDGAPAEASPAAGGTEAGSVAHASAASAGSRVERASVSEATRPALGSVELRAS
jgi:hypothetical protein